MNEGLLKYLVHDVPANAPFDPSPRVTRDGIGELGLALDKHLAGHPVRVDESDFIAWAREGRVPRLDQRLALREALLNFTSRDVLVAHQDGRASAKQVAALVVDVGGDENPAWNSLIRTHHPELTPRKIVRHPMADKLALWDIGGIRGVGV